MQNNIRLELGDEIVVEAGGLTITITPNMGGVELSTGSTKFAVVPLAINSVALRLAGHLMPEAVQVANEARRIARLQ